MTTETDRLPLSFKDCDGNTMYRNDLGRYHYHNVLGGCAKHCLWTFEWCRKNVGPLTDFEYDEPAPEPTPRIPDEFVCRSCDDSDEAFCYQHRYASLYARFRSFWIEYNATGEIPTWAQVSAPEPTARKAEPGCGNPAHRRGGPAEAYDNPSTGDCDECAPEPTPRKAEHGCGNCEGVDPKSCVMDHDTPPEPGDRVRVTYEATLGEPDYDGTPLTVVKTHDNIAIHNIIPADAEITVIERAAPKVPEEPEVGSVVEIDGGKRFVHRYDETCGWVATNGSAKYSWDELRRYFGTLYTVERGAVIGGE